MIERTTEWGGREKEKGVEAVECNDTGRGGRKKKGGGWVGDVECNDTGGAVEGKRGWVGEWTWKQLCPHRVLRTQPDLAPLVLTPHRASLNRNSNEFSFHPTTTFLSYPRRSAPIRPIRVYDSVFISYHPFQGVGVEGGQRLDHFFSHSPNQSRMVRYQTSAFAGLRTQCPSSGKKRIFDGTPMIWSAVNIPSPSEIGQRKSSSP